MTLSMPKNRWQAFAAHFSLSLLIFFVLMLTIVLLWYPGALFPAAGGWQGIRIVVGVDLVIGPLLTLIIYNAAKPRRLLYFDLAVIALIQFSCLAGGVFVVYNERPVAVAYAHDRFYALKGSDFVKAGKDPASLGLGSMTPTYFYVDMSGFSSNKEEAETAAALYRMAGKHLVFRTDLYKPLPAEKDGLAKVLAYNTAARDPRHGKECVTVGLETAYHSGQACLDQGSRRLKAFIREEEPGSKKASQRPVSPAAPAPPD